MAVASADSPPRGAEQRDGAAQQRQLADGGAGTGRGAAAADEGDRIVATRMDILARRTTFEFGVDDIKREPTTLRPFVTFEAAGESFFVTKSGFLEEADADLFGSNS